MLIYTTLQTLSHIFSFWIFIVWLFTRLMLHNTNTSTSVKNIQECEHCHTNSISIFNAI